MDSVSEALNEARYGEAVVVGISSEDEPSSSRELVLVATLDEDQGGIIWKDVTASPTSNENDDSIAIIRHIRTKKWLLPMLNDKRRNELYDAAIEAACREAVRLNIQGKKPLHILDIGSGTGLLAMMAAKHTMAALMNAASEAVVDPRSTVKVTSIEMASAMACLAKMTVASNQLESCVQVVEGHSCETVLENKAHVCTSELLESGLLGEGILPALRDAWKRHLHPNAVMVPQRARVYAQVLEGKGCVGMYRGPNLSTDIPVRLATSVEDKDVLLGCEENPRLGEGILVPIHAEALFRSSPLDDEEASTARVLCDPIMVLDFDFCQESIPGPEGRTRTTSLVPTASGTAHGVLFWWEIDLWGDLTYSTESGKEPWQDHWQQCLFVFPMSHEQCPQLVQGKEINIVCSHTDFRISFGIDTVNSVNEQPTKRQRQELKAPVESGFISRYISPERAMQLNDKRRISQLQQAISFALCLKGKDAWILDLSDFSLCAIIAARQGATHVSSLESSSGNVPLLSARVAQLGNGLPRTHETGQANFQVLQSHAENLSLDLFSGTPVQVVVAEPYYELLEGWHFQEALNYFYLVKSLKGKGVVSADGISVPSYAAVMGCAIQFDSFAKAYRGCCDTDGCPKVCGFSHEVVNKLGDRYHSHDASLPLHQYEFKKLTDSFELARICYSGDCFIDENNKWKSAPFRKTGTCHGLMCWIDYGLRVKSCSADDDFRVLSTFCRSHRQIFRMLSEPVTITEDQIGKTSFFCMTKIGGLGEPEDHTFDMKVQGYGI